MIDRRHLAPIDLALMLLYLTAAARTRSTRRRCFYCFAAGERWATIPTRLRP